MAAECAPESRRRIAIVVPGGVDRSGEYRVIPALLALLSRLSTRYEVHVFALLQEAAAGRWNLEGAHIHNIGKGATRVRAVAAIVREHCRGRFELIHSIWSGSSGLVAVLAAALLRVPSLVHVAGGELAALADIGYGGTLTRRGRLRESIVLRMASQVTAASASILSSIEAFGVRAQRVPLGIDTGRWPPKPPQRRESRTPARLLHVASLNRVKDQRTLLDALALLVTGGEDLRLDIVGEDTLGGEVQRLAHALGLEDHVVFHGFLTQRQWRPLAERAHLLVMSSRHEAGPIVMLEAAAVGLPTIGTAVGHISEWAPTAACAVQIADPAALAAAIRQLIHDEPLRLRIAAAAFRRAMRENADATARGFEELYERLTRRAGRIRTA